MNGDPSIRVPGSLMVMLRPVRSRTSLVTSPSGMYSCGEPVPCTHTARWATVPAEPSGETIEMTHFKIWKPPGTRAVNDCVLELPEVTVHVPGIVHEYVGVGPIGAQASALAVKLMVA